MSAFEATPYPTPADFAHAIFGDELPHWIDLCDDVADLSAAGDVEEDE